MPAGSAAGRAVHGQFVAGATHRRVGQHELLLICLQLEQPPDLGRLLLNVGGQVVALEEQHRRRAPGLVLLDAHADATRYLHLAQQLLHAGEIGIGLPHRAACSMKKMFFGSIGVIIPRRNFSPVIGT